MKKDLTLSFFKLFETKKEKNLKEMILFKAKLKILKAKKRVKDLQQRIKIARTMARRLLDRATAAGRLEAWFHLKENSANQGISKRQ